MESYLIEYKSKIIGVYTDYLQAETYILSCYQNNFIDEELNIIYFKTNSCLRTNSMTIKNKEKETNVKEKANSIIVNEKTEFNEKAYSIIAKEKTDLRHKLNILKHQKEKIKESMKVYENDLELFKLFTKNKNSDNNFIIPELFETKYKIFEKLVNEDRLAWDNFMKDFDSEASFNLNNYGDLFVTHDNNKKQQDDIYEELELDSL